MQALQRVLVVDSERTTPEVLRAALARRGVEVLSAQEPTEGLRLFSRFTPDVVVFDADLHCQASEFATAQLLRGDGDGPPLVVLGGKITAPRDHTRHLAKPYHYAALVRKIEQLLDEAAPDSRCA